MRGEPGSGTGAATGGTARWHGRRPPGGGGPPAGVHGLLLRPDRARLRGVPRSRSPARRPRPGLLRHAVGLVRTGIGVHARHVALRRRSADPGRVLGDLPLSPRLRVQRAPDVGPEPGATLGRGAWAQGYGTAYSRMLEEAGTHGAHGVIGVVDRVSNVADTGTTEFHFLGTAVTVEGGPPPPAGCPGARTWRGSD